MHSTGSINFPAFLNLIIKQKERARLMDIENDKLAAFVAAGGCPDKSGAANLDILMNILKNDFGLPIEVDDVLDMLDKNRSGDIDFEEFKALLA